MYLRTIKLHAVTFSMIVLVLSVCTNANAERSKFKPGDRVEVEDSFEWKPATVISVEGWSGWVEARIDKSPGHSGSGREKFPPSQVRASRRPKPRPVMDTPVRKWTDRSGKFSIDAKYQGLNGDKVVLVKSDGKRIEVPTAKLSDADARYLLEVKSAGDSPFQEVGDDENAAVAAVPDATPSKKVDWNGARLISPQQFSKWTYVPKSGKASIPVGGRTNANVVLGNIPDSDVFFEDVEGIYAADDAYHVVVSRNRGDVHQKKEPYIEVVDVKNQRAGGLIALPEETEVLDVDPNANLVMYRPAVFGSGENGILRIARYDSGGKLTPVQQWEPYSDEEFPPSRDIEKAWFLTDNRVMTINGHGKALTIWDVSASKALINIPVTVSFALELSLSPDRQLLAVIMKDGIALIDIAAGRHVATIATNGRHYQKVAIRTDNTKLAGLSDQGVTVWDLATGKVSSEFYCMAAGYKPSLDWAGNYLLADGRYLYDVDRRILLWEYQDSPGSNAKAQVQNGRLYAVNKPMGDRGRITLVSTAVPHAAALEKAKTLPPPEAMLVVKPGDEVSIDVDIDPSVSLADEVQKIMNANIETASNKHEKLVVLNPSGAQNDVIRQLLTNALEEAGLKVVEKSDLVVKAVCKPQPPQTIRVNVDGRFPPRPEDYQERSITPHASYLEMSLKGQTLWKRGYVAQPVMTIWFNKGETLDQALERYTKPNVGLFTSAKFSPYVARPGKATPNGAYGVSQFTAHGLVDSRSATGRNASFE